MTTTPKKAKAPTDQQIVERLAKFMGWELRNYEQDRPAVDAADREDAFRNDGWHWYGSEMSEDAHCWKPHKNWNHWRQVEEKVMEDEPLWNCYVHGVLDATQNMWKNTEKRMMKADLPTRCKALISALNSLKSNAQ